MNGLPNRERSERRGSVSRLHRLMGPITRRLLRARFGRHSGENDLEREPHKELTITGCNMWGLLAPTKLALY